MKLLRKTFANVSLFISLLLLISGCSGSSGKVLIGDSKKPLNISYVAILPVDHPVGVRAERIDRTKELVEGELRMRWHERLDFQ